MRNPTPKERADLIFHDLADPNKQDETIRETVERHIREAVSEAQAATVEMCAKHYIKLATDSGDLCACGEAVEDWPQHLRSISSIDMAEHDRKVRLEEHFNSCSSHSPDSFDSAGMMVEPIWCSREHPCVKAQRLASTPKHGFCVRHGADCKREDCNPIRVDLPKEPR